MDTMFRQRRISIPKRTSELVALLAVSSTLFLFLHTRDLSTKLRRMEEQSLADDTTGRVTTIGRGGEGGRDPRYRRTKESRGRGGGGGERGIGTGDANGCFRDTTRHCAYAAAASAAPPREHEKIGGQTERGFPTHQEYKAAAGDATQKATNHERFGPKRTLEEESEEEESGGAGGSLQSLAEDALLPEPWELNNTARAGLDVLFFNRVPKVGSQTFMELLRRLAIRNNFGFNRDAVQRVETIRLAPADQQVLASLVVAHTPPSAYIKHVCYTNFTRYGYPTPIYVNVVRDPVERVISWYYYVRAPWYYVERKRAFPDLPLPDPAWLKKDFETCVLSGDRECRYLQGETHEGIGDHRRQTLFFCGHEADCTPFNSLGALQRAKRVVESQYAVVGVLEDMNATLSALEHYAPRFFHGAATLYWEELSTFNRINRNAFKPPVSEEVKNIVRANFTREIEFYEFCRQRLHLQLKALRLPTPVSSAAAAAIKH